MCCGTPWKSKGLAGGHDRMTRAGAAGPVGGDRRGAAAGGLRRIVLHRGAGARCGGCGRADGQWSGLRFVDAVEFAAERLLPGLTVTAPLGSLALHPTCSSTRLGCTDACRHGRRAVAEGGDGAGDWGCCAFAGDRGLLHPELTASATAREAAEVAGRQHDAYASVQPHLRDRHEPGHRAGLRAPAGTAGAGHPLTRPAARGADEPRTLGPGRADGSASGKARPQHRPGVPELVAGVCRVLTGSTSVVADRSPAAPWLVQKKTNVGYCCIQTLDNDGIQHRELPTCRNTPSWTKSISASSWRSSSTGEHRGSTSRLPSGPRSPR